MISTSDTIVMKLARPGRFCEAGLTASELPSPTVRGGTTVICAGFLVMLLASPFRENGRTPRLLRSFSGDEEPCGYGDAKTITATHKIVRGSDRYVEEESDRFSSAK
jgi:hypothetical protein